jgi:PAS domain S-box-containing protein/putative nucleotidyltransferase with HDIG domain
MHRHTPRSVSIRIALPALLTVFLFATAVFLIVMPALEESFIARKKEMIKELTESAWSILAASEALEKSGEISRDQAQQRAIEMIQQLRYGPERKDYFWLNDMTPHMIMHPYRADLNGKNIREFMDPNNKKLFVEFVDVVKKEGEGYVEYMWQWKDDATRIVPKISYVKGFQPWGWIIGSGIYVNDVYLEIDRIRGKLYSITGVIFILVVGSVAYIIRQTILADKLRQRIWDERSALLSALEMSEEQYRSMVEYTSDWIWEMDPTGTYTYCSPKVQELLGYSPIEVEGKKPFDLMVSGEVEHAGKRFRDMLSLGKPFTGLESICRHRDGRSIVIEKNGVPFFNIDHELIGYRGVARDISERKRSEEALWKSHNQLHRNLEETVRSLALTAEKRDPYTAGHQIRVERLAHAIALELGMTEKQLQGLHFAALLHDIGKISLPSEYLAKPTTLSKEERTIIKCHTEAGYEILKSIHFPWPVAEIVRQHHELLDGSGYPRGLKDAEILLEAKIITVADVVEAMSSHRPYRPALGLDAALEEIQKGKGKKYHKQSVEACLYLVRERQFDLGAASW